MLHSNKHAILTVVFLCVTVFGHTTFSQVFDRESFENLQIAGPDFAGKQFASFAGWDDSLIRSSGQTFYDVFEDGSGVDITVRASGTYSAEYSPGVATTYVPGTHQIGTSALDEWNQLTFQLNTDETFLSPFSPGPDRVADFVPGPLFVHTTTLGTTETVRAVSLGGQSVDFEQFGSAAKPQPVGNGTHVVEVRGGSAGNEGIFTFSKPSSFAVTHATTSDYAWQSYQLGRLVSDPERPVTTDGNGIPFVSFPSEGTPEFARFTGWDDDLIRSQGQRFLDVFGDGKLNVEVTSLGSYSQDSHLNTLGGTDYGTFAQAGTDPEGQRNIVTTAEDEWNTLIFRLEPVTFDDGVRARSDIGGDLFLTSSNLEEDDLVRVVALDGSPLAYQEDVAGAPVAETQLADHSVEVTGTGNGAEAGNGSFEFQASTFQLTYAVENGVGYQFFQIGRDVDTLDPCSRRLLILEAREAPFGSDLCADLTGGHMVDYYPADSFVAVPEPTGVALWGMGMFCLMGLRRRRL